MVLPSSNGHPHLWEIRDSKIIPQALVENQSPVSLSRRYAPRKGRLETDFQPRPSGDFAVSDFPEVRIRVAKNIENATLALTKHLYFFRGSASFVPRKFLYTLAWHQPQS